MKKQMTGALFMLLIVVSAQAQTRNTKQSRVKGIHRFEALAHNASASSTAKTTATLWRIAATSSYSIAGTSVSIDDSAKYQYSNGRGSSFNFRNLYAEDYGIDSKLLYDTATKYRDMGNGLEKSERYFAMYNSSNQMSEQTQQYANSGQYVNSQKTIPTRDANGNTIKLVSLSWNNGTNQWDTSTISVMSYDAQNHLLSDSSYTLFGGMPTPAYRSKYTYDGSGNQTQFVYDYWDGNAWLPNYKAIFTYIGNKQSTSTYQEYVKNTWRNTDMDSVGYNGSGIYNYYEYREWDTLGSKWINTEREMHTINGNGTPSKVMYADWNKSTKMWETYGEANLTYDANGNATRVDNYEYNGSVKNPFPSYVNNYYYEFYYNVGIKDAPKNSTVIIYPNPATTSINIVLDGQNEASLSLVNMAGQTVRMMNVANNTQKAVMNITGLPAGNYILTIQAAGAIPTRQMIAIQ